MNTTTPADPAVRVLNVSKHFVSDKAALRDIQITVQAGEMVALLGAYHVVMVWTRVGRQRFRNEEELEQFLAEFEPAVAAGGSPAAAAGDDAGPSDEEAEGDDG